MIDDEVTVDNCERWLPLIELISTINELNVMAEKDYFCMIAVKNSQQENQITSETPTWHLTPKNNAYLQAVSLFKTMI